MKCLQVIVPLPDVAGRAAILAVHMRLVPVEGGAAANSGICERVAQLSGGCSGADLANVVNEAALLAARRSAVAVALPDFIEVC